MILSDKDEIKIQTALEKRGIAGGYPLCRASKGAKGILYCATELHTKAQMDAFLIALEEVSR